MIPTPQEALEALERVRIQRAAMGLLGPVDLRIHQGHLDARPHWQVLADGVVIAGSQFKPARRRRGHK